MKNYSKLQLAFGLFLKIAFLLSGMTSHVCSMAQNFDCIASVGTVFPPEINFICPGGLSAPIGIVGDNQTGFQTVWLIASDNDSIVGLSYSNIINAGNLDFPASTVLGSGAYHIRPLNVDISQIAQLLAIISSGTVSYVTDIEAQISNNNICAAIGNYFTMLIPPPIYVGYEIICDEVNQGTYYVDAVVTGGIPALSSDYAYTYAGALLGSSLDHGTNLALGPFTDGAGFLLTVLDACSTVNVEQISVACTKCDYTAGTMSAALHEYYNNEPLSVPGSIGATLEGVSMYVLHTSNDTILGTILAIDTLVMDGSADFGLNVPELLPETTYYVSMFVGNDNEPEDGWPDNDGCSKVCYGTPIRVLGMAPILPAQNNGSRFKPTIIYNADHNEIILDFWVAKEGQIDVALYNINGECLTRWTIDATAGANHWVGPMGKQNGLLSAGMYVASLRDKKQVQVIKFMGR